MATSKRDLIKRKHTAIHNSLTRALGWSIELSNQFKEHHPDYAQGYNSIALMIDQTRDFIDKMKAHI